MPKCSIDKKSILGFCSPLTGLDSEPLISEVKKRDQKPFFLPTLTFLTKRLCYPIFIALSDEFEKRVSQINENFLLWRSLSGLPSVLKFDRETFKGIGT